MHEPGLPELVRDNAERLHFTTDMDEVLDNASLLFCCVDTPPDLLGRRRPLARRGGHRRAGPVRRPRDRHEEHRAGRHRPVHHAPLPQRRLRLQPGVPQGGLRGQGLHAPRPRGDRSRRRLERLRRPRRSAVRDPGRRARAHRRRQRRDGQAGLQRLPRHQDLLHQRDRQRLGGAGRRRLRGGARDGPRRAHRPEVPPGGHRLRRLVLSQGRIRAQAAGRQHRLPLPAADRGDRGQRAPEAAHHRQAAEAPRLPGGQADRAAGRRLQAQHRRRARGHQPGPLRAAAGRGRERARVRPGGRRRRSRHAGRRHHRRLGRGGARRRRRRRAGDRVARVRRAGLDEPARADERAADRRRAQLPRRGRPHGGGLQLRGHRPRRPCRR